MLILYPSKRTCYSLIDRIQIRPYTHKTLERETKLDRLAFYKAGNCPDTPGWRRQIRASGALIYHMLGRPRVPAGQRIEASTVGAIITLGIEVQW